MSAVSLLCAGSFGRGRSNFNVQRHEPNKSSSFGRGRLNFNAASLQFNGASRMIRPALAAAGRISTPNGASPAGALAGRTFWAGNRPKSSTSQGPGRSNFWAHAVDVGARSVEIRPALAKAGRIFGLAPLMWGLAALKFDRPRPKLVEFLGSRRCGGSQR